MRQKLKNISVLISNSLPFKYRNLVILKFVCASKVVFYMCRDTIVNVVFLITKSTIYRKKLGGGGMGARHAPP